MATNKPRHTPSRAKSKANPVTPTHDLIKENDQKTHVADNAEIKKELIESAIVGVVMALLLSAFSLGGTGGENANKDFLHHALFVHPLFWVLPNLAFVTYVIFCTTPGRSVIEKIAIPILKFHAHIFSVALGASIIITPYILWHTYSNIVSILVLFLLVIFAFGFQALMCTAGLKAAENEELSAKVTVRVFWSYALVAVIIAYLAGNLINEHSSAHDFAITIGNSIDQHISTWLR